jgi:hypothetical protein
MLIVLKPDHMKKTLRTAAIITIAGVALYYPAMKLYELIVKKIEDRKKQMAEGADGATHVKAFLPAFRGKHKPHHRHPHEGNGTPDMAN